MPDNNQRRDDEFAKYDAMSTEELQQILREDASKPVGEESDSQALFYIMEVLAKRRKERNEGRSAAEALESFKNNYYTEAENSFDSESATVTRKQFNGGRWRRGLVAAVAAICILIVGNSITASALGFDLFEIIAKWTQETFHFGFATDTTVPDEPVKEDARIYTGLREFLLKLDVSTTLAPTWFPDGYEEIEIKVEDSPLQRRFIAKYQSGDNTIRIRIVDYLSGAPTQIEQSDSLLDIYSLSGIDYYIFENDSQLQAVWVNENYECYISGPLTLSEIKEIIDSIEKG